MIADLELYALQALARRPTDSADGSEMDTSLVSIEDRMSSFDVQAARESLKYVTQGFKELRHEMAVNRFIPCGACGETETDCVSYSSEDSDKDCDDRNESGNRELRDVQENRDRLFCQQQQTYAIGGLQPMDDYEKQPSEMTPLL